MIESPHKPHIFGIQQGVYPLLLLRLASLSQVEIEAIHEALKPGCRIHNAICAQLKRLILKCMERESVHCNLDHKAPCRFHTFTHIHLSFQLRVYLRVQDRQSGLVSYFVSFLLFIFVLTIVGIIDIIVSCPIILFLRQARIKEMGDTCQSPSLTQTKCMQWVMLAEVSPQVSSAVGGRMQQATRSIQQVGFKECFPTSLPHALHVLGCHHVSQLERRQTGLFFEVSCNVLIA